MTLYLYIIHPRNLERETNVNFYPSLVKEEMIEPEKELDFIIEEGNLLLL